MPDHCGALALGFALAFSSTAIVLPIAGTHSPVGRAALSMLLFEDIMIVPIIFVLGAMAPNAAGEGWEGMLRVAMLLDARLSSLLSPVEHARSSRPINSYATDGQWGGG